MGQKMGQKMGTKIYLVFSEGLPELADDEMAESAHDIRFCSIFLIFGFCSIDRIGLGDIL